MSDATERLAPLILASSSLQRRRLLAEAGYQFRVQAPGIAEPNPADHDDPSAYVAHTAWLKARAVAATVATGRVLAADTIVTVGGAILGKAADRADASRILRRLSGSVHHVLTGVCLWSRPGDYWIGLVTTTECEMQALAESEMERYLDSELWVDKAGAYGIQDSDPYVRVVRGSFSNVVGLPVEEVSRLLAIDARTRE